MEQDPKNKRGTIASAPDEANIDLLPSCAIVILSLSADIVSILTFFKGGDKLEA